MSWEEAQADINAGCLDDFGEAEGVIYRRNGYPDFSLRAIIFQPVQDMLNPENPGQNERIFFRFDDWTSAAPVGMKPPSNAFLPATYDYVVVRGFLYQLKTPKHDISGGITATLTKQ